MPERMILHYRVERRIGAGGMGEVLLAQDTKLERSVAIKLMSEKLASDPNHRKRFQTEARSASALNHPNVCVIHEVGETPEGRPFLAMEYVAGQTLEAIEQQRRIKIREAVSIGAQVAEALDAAQSRGLVHRDIKPGNIMLDARGHVKVLDFGLAKRFGVGDGAVSTISHTETSTGFLVGTPHYMSPEQALGAELDHRSDIFSLGVVLYEMVVGQRPFLGKSVGEIINKIINDQPKPLDLENPVYTPALDNIIFKCLEKKPENRYASAHELAQDLNKLRGVNGHSIPTPVPENRSEDSGTKLWQLPDKAKTKPAWTTALVALAAIGLVAGIAAAFLKSRSNPTGESLTSGEVGQKSVAVLPFDNFSAEKDTEYLSDGLTEEITTALARIPGLKVAARNSAFAFKGKKEDLRKVGSTLGVATVLEGSLRKSGDQIRVTAQLVNTADGFHLWSETFDSSVTNMIALQEEIARKIAGRFALRPGDNQVASTANRHIPPPEAYGLYLQALQSWNLRTVESLERAVELFSQAIQKDPAYADAHAGLAATYGVLPDYVLRPSREYYPLARTEAAKALELDPNSADAHATLGLIKAYTYDYDGAEVEFKRAIQINPNHSTAHHWYGVDLREMNRMAESREQLRLAEELDPLSAVIKFNILAWYAYSRDFDRGLELCQQYQQAFPKATMFHSARAWLLGLKGQHKEALAELEKYRADAPGPQGLGPMAYSYARLGDEAKARQILVELEDWKKKGYVVRDMIAVAHLGLREYDKALDAWSEAFDANEMLSGFLNDPTYDEVRDQPRFQELIRKLGLRKNPAL